MNKIEGEKLIVQQMIRLYCNKCHHSSSLCDSCLQLSEYAVSRLEKCPFGERKTSCSACKIHCYEPQMRKEIRRVMRFSGPRMLFYHPILFLNHYLLKK
ncbi:MAG: nitrous oxide-stimulated promoter family protein [Paludibacteraceae bacterium]|nr:nitrous oxide-stimulated promoter family protein [Paludibacteraceae bacterium]